METAGNTLLRWSCFIGYLSICLSSDHSPKVRVDSGEVAGGFGLRTYNNGRQLYTFLGIPYASPPVGEYRFKVWRTNKYGFEIEMHGLNSDMGKIVETSMFRCVDNFKRP